MPSLPAQRRHPRSRPARRPAEHRDHRCRPSASASGSATRIAAGQREIEVGSFVPPKLMPQLADTAEVLAFAKTLPGLFASVLVPNLKGAERALEGDADLMLLPLSASHAHSLANLRKTPDEVVAELGRIRAARDASGRKTLIEGGVGTAFGCTIQGEVEPSRSAAADAGAARRRRRSREPGRHRRLRRSGRRSADLFEQALKHRRRPLLLRPLPRYARPRAGQRLSPRCSSASTRFDASLAGIGGCPHAPGASGNASTEDLAFMLPSDGHRHRHRHRALLALRAKVAGWLEGEPTHGTLWRAGLAARPSDLRRATLT